MIEHILVPLDGSSPAEQALLAAAALQPREISVLTVVSDDPGGGLRLNVGSYAQAHENRLQVAQEYVSKFEDQYERDNLSINGVVAYGHPGEEILRASQQCDFIVMSTQGKDATSRALLGSVADRVARHSEVPVMLVRSGSSNVAAPTPTRIVVPLDGSAFSEQAIDVALKLADQTGASVHFQRVFPREKIDQALRAGGTHMTRFAKSTDDVKHAYDAYLQEKVESLRDSATGATWTVPEGEPAEVIMKSTSPGDLVVMTSLGRGGVARFLFGSVADRVVRLDDVPIVIVNPQDDQSRST